MFEIDGLYVWCFEFNENLLDQVDLVVEVDQLFVSEDWVLVVESLDGCICCEWCFFYNVVMEVEFQVDGEFWCLIIGEGVYQFCCLGVVSVSGEDE